MFCYQIQAQNITSFQYSDTLILDFKKLSKTPDTLVPQIYHAKTVVKQIPKKEPNTYNLRYEKLSILDTIIETENSYQNIKTPIKFSGNEIKNQTITDLPQFFFKDNAKSNIKYSDISHGFFSNSIFDIN